MIRNAQNQYNPDSVSPPGETLLETIEALGMSQAELADRTGRSKKTINHIIKGKAPVTPVIALELESVLGVPASFWNNFECNYREFLARRKEKENLKKYEEWLSSIPVRQMIKKGWIKGFKNRVDQIKEALRFFAIASPDQWENVSRKYLAAAYRKSNAFETDSSALVAWLRKGELDAQKIECAPYDKDKFGDFLDRKIRTLTNEPPEVFESRLIDICAACGVAVVFVPRLQKMPMNGATRWLTTDKAIIQLSLRYKTDDQLWFSFFHESQHILRHGKKDVFIEINDLAGHAGKDYWDDPREEEANRFAADLLIPPRQFKAFLERNRFSKRAIREFASQVGISAGIVVGRLQYEKVLPYSNCNDLKQKISVG
ncbi:MAG: ImmA/IrrE family metallo-endopeptidase [Deltaproteobacteria bacterium]|nr:ImmA/IrrE family metallo-endopeptidase [Deltaproteobacteria bacterium]